MLDERPWNTARCSRLLRPLTSSLSSLKIQQARIARDLQRHSGLGLKQGPDLAASTSSEDYVSTGGLKRGHPDGLNWTEFGVRKRVKRTYSSRANILRSVANTGTHKSSQICEPGKIIVSTPVISRTGSRNKLTGSTFSQHSLGQEVENPKLKPRKDVEMFSSRNRRMTPIEAVITAFDALMKQTQPDAGVCNTTKTISSSGTLSLFSLCLRNIPAFIADEQAWRKEQNSEDKSDASADTFEFLESLGCGRENGWNPLREVVRAQGLAMTLDAIEDHVIPAVQIKSLIEVCIVRGAMAEAESLLQAWIRAHGDFARPSTTAALSCELLDMLDPLLEVKPTSTAFQCRVLLNSIKSGQYPVEWIATTKFNKIWQKIIQSLTEQQDDTREAESLVTLLLYYSSGTRVDWTTEECLDHLPKQACEYAELPLEFQEAVANTISSFCTIISAIMLLQKDSHIVGTPWLTCTSCTRPIHLAASHLDDQSCFNSEKVNIHISANQMIICATQALLQLTGIRDRSETDEGTLELSIYSLMQACNSYDQAAGRTSTSNQIVSQHICSVARCYGRAQGDTGFDCLERIVTCMLEYGLTCNNTQDHATITFVQRLALDSIMNFTEASSNPEHIRLANRAEKLLGEGSAKYQTGVCNTNDQCRPSAALDGLRWEEGICEWVATTPAAMLKLKTSKKSMALVDQLSSKRTIAALNPGIANTPCRKSCRYSPIASRVFDAPSSPQFGDSPNVSFDFEDGNMVDSGIFVEDTDWGDGSNRRCLKFSKPTDDDKENEESQANISDEEDELAIIDPFNRRLPSLHVSRKRTKLVQNTSQIQKQVSKAQQQMYVWDLMSDELG